jgi:hypothetical protein
MNISDLFANYSNYAFRLESLPAYVVEDEVEALALFTASGVLPEGHNAEWAEEIAANVSAGKRMERLRLFTLPLNGYERFERAVYEINVEAGEDIRAADIATFDPPVDFWAFDDEWIARMVYDDDGRWHGADVAAMTDADRAVVDYWRSVFASTPALREGFPLK